MDLTLILFGALALLCVSFAGFTLAKDLDKKQTLLFGYFLLPVIVGLYGGYIPYPIHPGKIYLLYVVISNVVVYKKERTAQFFSKYGAHLAGFFFVLLTLNALCYVSRHESALLLAISSVYLSSLFFVALFAFNAHLTMHDIDRVVLRYFLFVLIPIFLVCIVEVMGSRSVAMFFAGPQYDNVDFERLGFYRINGIFHWPNNLGNFLSCFYLLYMWRAAKSKVFFACGLITFVFLALTLTRASIVACALITALAMRKHFTRHQKYVFVVAGLCSVVLLYDFGRKVVAEMTEQYVHNMSPRTYYMVQGFDIARQNFPLGEGMYSTGALVEKAGDEDFKSKYRLSVIEYKTTDSFFAALFIELGILGTLVLVAMFIWLYARAKVAPLRYLIILFLLTGYSNADILSMVSPESIVCFLLVGISFHYCTAPQRTRLYAAKAGKTLQLLGRRRRQHAVRRSSPVARRLWAGTG